MHFNEGKLRSILQECRRTTKLFYSSCRWVRIVIRRTSSTDSSLWLVNWKSGGIVITITKFINNWFDSPFEDFGCGDRPVTFEKVFFKTGLISACFHLAVRWWEFSKQCLIIDERKGVVADHFLRIMILSSPANFLVLLHLMELATVLGLTKWCENEPGSLVGRCSQFQITEAKFKMQNSTASSVPIYNRNHRYTQLDSHRRSVFSV